MDREDGQGGEGLSTEHPGEDPAPGQSSWTLTQCHVSLFWKGKREGTCEQRGQILFPSMILKELAELGGTPNSFSLGCGKTPPNPGNGP